MKHLSRSSRFGLGLTVWILLLVSGCKTETEVAPVDPPPGVSPTTTAPSPDPPVTPPPTRPTLRDVGPGSVAPSMFGDFIVTGEAREFGPDNLYDLINGGSEVFVEYGLVRMITADYRARSMPHRTVTLEVYDQGSPAGAFGRFSRYLVGHADPAKSADGLPPELVARAALGRGDLVAWKDRYLVHATLLDEAPDATADSLTAAGRELLPQVATAVFARIAEDPPRPVELERLPVAERQARTEAYDAKSVLGLGPLPGGFSARYSGSFARTLFVTAPLTDASQARAAIAALGAAGQEKTTLAGVKDAIQLVTSDGRHVALAPIGSRIVGLVVDVEPWPTPEAVAGELQRLTATFAAP